MDAATRAAMDTLMSMPTEDVDIDIRARKHNLCSLCGETITDYDLMASLRGVWLNNGKVGELFICRGSHLDGVDWYNDYGVPQWDEEETLADHVRSGSELVLKFSGGERFYVAYYYYEPS